MLLFFEGTWSSGGNLVLAPNWQNPVIPLQKGTQITPLCDPSLNVPCFQQWTHLAQPFAVTAPGALLPSYEYFLPSLIIDARLPADTVMDEGDWELFTPSFPGRRSSSSRRRTRYYINRSDPGRIREVKTDKRRNTTIKEGELVYVSVEVIKMKLENSSKKTIAKSLSEEKKKDGSTTVLPPYQKIFSKKISLKQRIQTKPFYFFQPLFLMLSLQVFADPDPVRENTESAEKEGEGTQKENSEEKAILTENTNGVGNKVQPQEEVLSGCISTDLRAPENNPVESFSCAECNIYLNKGFKTLPEDTDILKKIDRLLDAVVHGDKSFGKWAEFGSQQRIKRKIAGSICSPDVALRKIISNFNSNCGNHTFEEFFPRSYCKSCRKGVPGEIMLAIMSVESAGKCSVTQKNKRETSFGLFQINSREYQCKRNKKNTKANKVCLLNPYNSLKYGIKILNAHYNEVNPKRKTSSSCSRWADLTPVNRDRWRRAVSAYNSGSGWIDRAVQSVEGQNQGRDFSQSTKDLEWSHFTHKFKGQTKKSEVSWEDLRIYYFIEKLLPANNPGASDKNKTGRELQLTISNLAHTEAVLGREVKNKGSLFHGMVKYWGEYIEKHKPSCLTL